VSMISFDCYNEANFQGQDHQREPGGQALPRQGLTARVALLRSHLSLPQGVIPEGRSAVHAGTG
jgi:hypothetical protein